MGLQARLGPVGTSHKYRMIGWIQTDQGGWMQTDSRGLLQQLFFIRDRAR
jgi:hypothetical protein